MSRPLIIISRNPASYLSGHSIFAWQLSEFLGGSAQVPVLHITHTTDEGPRHSVDITPPVSALLYRRIEVEYQAMEEGTPQPQLLRRRRCGRRRASRESTGRSWGTCRFTTELPRRRRERVSA